MNLIRRFRPKWSHRQNSICWLFVGVALLSLTAPARGGVIHEGWTYAVDSQSDGSGAASGFEMRGLAFRESAGMTYFAVSSGLPLGGTLWGGALNDRISYGDLILNFSRHNLDSAADFVDPYVFAIRFDASNDSLGNVGGSNTTLGLFGNIGVSSLTLQNSGYGSLQQYYNSGFAAATGAMGDLNTTTDVVNYFGSGTIFPNIQSGNFIGGITLLNEGELATLGVDFGNFGADPSGNHVFGFSLASNLLPSGDFVESLFFECGNDGVALFGTVPEVPFSIQAVVPEPSSLMLLGIGVAGVVGWRVRRR